MSGLKTQEEADNFWEHHPYGGGWNFELDNMQNVAWQEKTFTSEECKEIIKICDTYPVGKARTVGDSEKEMEARKNDSGWYPRYKTNVAWIYPSEKTNWIFARVARVVLDLNQKFFGFDIFGLTEGFQYTSYHDVGSEFKKHQDRNISLQVRKLSVSIQLTKPEEYKGCDLLVHTDHEPFKASKEVGCLTMFPSWTLHEVTPLISGKRHALVAWVTGRPFK